jgi:hypothetical protein
LKDGESDGNAIKIQLRKLGCEEGRWMELDEDRVQCEAPTLAVLKFRILSS